MRLTTMKRLRKAWWLREVHAHKRVQAWRKRYDGAKARRKHYDDLIAHHQPFKPLFGIDWAFDPPDDFAKLRAAGVHFACRYLSHTPSKNLTRAEAESLAGHGINSVVVWETTAGRALAGRAAGQTDAVTAAGQAKACGAPADAVIYFAVDFNMQASQRDAVEAYFRGVNSAIGVKRTGAYGGLAAIKALFDAKLISKGWQTYAWSGTPTQWDRRRHIQQEKNGQKLAGGTVDFNHAVKPDYGGWRPR